MSSSKVPNKVVKPVPSKIVTLVKSAKVLSERISFVKSSPNKNASPISGRNKFSEKYSPPSCQTSG